MTRFVFMEAKDSSDGIVKVAMLKKKYKCLDMS